MASRNLVIGDIHGCLANFEAMLEAIAPSPDDQLWQAGANGRVERAHISDFSDD